MLETNEEGLIYACRLLGDGRAVPLDWAGVRAWKPADGPVWIHLERLAPVARRWLAAEAGLEPSVVEALLADETRPRVVVLESGIMLILRGVNLNPGSDPEDMVAPRLWVDPDRVITVRQRKVMAIQDLRDRIAAGAGPHSAPEFVVQLASALISRMGGIVDQLDDVVDALEEQVVAGNTPGVRMRLVELRREAIILRRHIAPQRDALVQLQSAPIPWLTSPHRAVLREVVDRVTRYVEDLDAARERAAVTHEELSSRTAEQMNRTMYVLSLVAAVFLPLGLLTGLLGINVGGIPGGDNPYAFLGVCALLILLAVVQVFLFRRMRWL